MIALVDCNNFFVSCERVFNPGLRDKPVAVLSSNDGCVIARSNEVKELGVPMGAPLFKYRDLLNSNGVVVRSSNFALYTDMSRRVMATIHAQMPDMEVYSVDEAFVDVTGISNPAEWGVELRDIVMRDTGIPVSIGIASTRTLAKASATIAKKQNGVMSFAGMSGMEIDEHLSRLSSSDVWGIGRRMARQFAQYRLLNAADIRNMSDRLMRKFNVSTRRTILELRGIPVDTEQSSESKSMVSTRSFGSPVSDKAYLREALCMHAMKLTTKLRRESLGTRMITAFISTGHQGEFLHASKGFPVATSNTQEVTRAVVELLDQIYHPGLMYKKAGVMAYKLTPVRAQQLAFGSDTSEMESSEKVDTVIDEVNEKWGPHALKLAAEGFNHSWQPKHVLRSPRYTTEWSELKTVN